jgi:hypothetical protein
LKNPLSQAAERIFPLKNYKQGFLWLLLDIYGFAKQKSKKFY